MSTQIIVDETQKGHCQTYKCMGRPGEPLTALICAGDDWPYKYIFNPVSPVSPASKLCSRVCNDTSHCSVNNGTGNGICPCIDNVSPNIKFVPGTNPTVGEFINRNETFNATAGVKCTYNLNQFQNIDAVMTYVNSFASTGKFDKNLIDVIGPEFCFLQSTNCPLDVTTGLPMKVCSNFVSLDEEIGRFCGNWRIQADKISPKIVDNAFTTYCAQTSPTPDCTCVNCNKEDVCRTINENLPGKIGCWFIPCKTVEDYLVPFSELKPDCDATVCEQVINIINNKNLNINTKDFKTTIDCSSGGLGDQPTTPVSTFRNLIIGIIIVVIIIIIIVVVAGRR